MSTLSVQFFLIHLNDFLHRIRTRSSDCHTFLHAGLHGDRIVDIFLKYRADRLELLFPLLLIIKLDEWLNDNHYATSYLAYNSNKSYENKHRIAFLSLSH